MGDLIDDTTKAIDIVNRESLQYSINQARKERDYWQRELNRLEALDPDRNRDA